MNIRDLKYLTAIAEHGHFGQAAQACFVSQPALSMQIKKLEQYLGVQLFERTNKSVTLTDIGHLMTTHAHGILNRVEAMQEAAKLAKDPFSGEFRIGVIPTLAPYLLPKIMPVFTKSFPKISIFLIEDQTPALINKLNTGKLDVALLGLPRNEPNLISMPLFEEEFLLAIPPKHPLTKRKIVRLADLKDQSLLLLEDGHCMRDFALELCYQANASEAQGFQATGLETLRQMVAANAGITLIPNLAYKAKDSICYLPFAAPKPTRIIGMMWRTTSARQPLLKHSADVIRKVMAKDKAVRVLKSTQVCLAAKG